MAYIFSKMYFNILWKTDNAVCGFGNMQLDESSSGHL